MDPKPKMFGYAHWRARRSFLFAVNALCFVVIFYALFKGLDTRTSETAVSMAFTTIIASVGSYVFGATWEDIRNGPRKD